MVITDDVAVRDPQLPARLLLTERAELLPLLRRTPEEYFDRPTACPEWTVRQMLAHCSAALVRIVEGRLPGFTPENNACDVLERVNWPLSRVLDELDEAMVTAGPAIAEADGQWDVIALGEWVHAGDVRDAFGAPGAYEGAGLEDALALLRTASRIRLTPRVHASTRLGEMTFGNLEDGRDPAELITDPGTLIRLYAGRRPDPDRYRLIGADPAELVIYR
ncbi:maleylpyruvate isomerase family mycothiol-dependent enzyme [Kitasatospora sp. NPDC002227]|uniref:maleylpyruvate isomerase family mycothiol-dependent enzyme n=1 Tax=Kitasatospora sp. NPDC002227 TaxID=3154773 RepID=UPI00332223BC